MRGWRLARACVLSEYSKPKLPEETQGVFRILALSGCAVIHGLLRLTGRKPAFFYRRFVHEARKYEKEAPEEYVQMCDKAFPPEYNLAGTLFPTVAVPFEDTEVMIPGDPDTYLKDLYGNYMQLPPPEKRHNHYPAELDFGEEGGTAGQ